VRTFYKHIFLPNNTDPKFEDLSFSDELVRHLFTPYRGVLLNVGNMTKVFDYGLIYEADPENKTNLQQLTEVTRAENEPIAIVVYRYLKYFVYEFAMKLSKGGSRKMTGYAQNFQRYLYRAFNKYYEWLKREYLALLVG
jgi:hypothetical protein